MSPATDRPANHPSTRALLHAMLRQTGRLTLPAAVAVAATVPTQPGHALDRTWIGGNTVWTDNVGAANWSPADEPDSDDNAIFNTANSVDLGSNNSIETLTMSGGIDLSTLEFTLTTDLDTTLTGNSTNLNLGGNDIAGLNQFSGLSTENVTLSSGAQINIGGNRLLSQATAGEATITLNTGTTISGNGLIQNNDSAAAPFSMLVNNGTISVQNYSTGIVIIGGTPAARTLTIGAFDADARLDLDGTTGLGTVNVFRNQTLDINVELLDAFDGAINLFQESTLSIEDAWIMSGGTMTVDNGAIAAVFPFPSTPAGVAFIQGGQFTQTGGTILVTDADGELNFQAGYTGNGGTIDATSGGTVRFSANATINNGHTLSLGANGQLIIDNDATVTVNDDDFDMDGTGGADVTIRNGAVLNIRGDTLDGASFPQVFQGDLIFQDDDNNAATGGDQIFDFDITAVNGDIELRTVRAQSGTGRIRSQTGDNVTLGGTVIISSGASLVLDALSTTFSGAGSVSGAAGSLFFDELVSIDDDTTITVGDLDIDNGSGSLLVNPAATLTLNATNIETVNTVFEINGGTAVVSTANYNFGTSSLLRFSESGVGAVNPLYDGAGTVTFLSGSAINNSSDGATFDSDAVFQEGSSINNSTATAILNLGGAGEIIELNGGDITQSVAGSRVDVVGTWRVTGDSSVNTTRIDLDGGTITLATGGALDVNVDSIETSGAELHDGMINFEGGTLNIDNAVNEWIADGIYNSNGGGSLFGDRVVFGDDLEVLNSDINVNSGTLNIGAPATFNADADVFVAGGATLLINNAGTIFTPRNGTEDAEFTGTGTLRIVGAQFDEVTTLNMTGGTVGLDGSLSGNGGLTILTAGDTDINSTVTINAATFDPFGFSTGIIPFASQSEINIADTARLTVNLDSPTGEWQVLSNGIINYAGNGTIGSFLAGNRLDLDGTLNVTGDGQALNELEIGGTINLLTAADGLMLAATNNEIDGGTINGPGELGAGIGDWLVGNGTINANIDFEGSTGYLEASGGLLDMNGLVLDVGSLRTNGGAAVFDLANALNTSVTDSGLILNGGRFQGANITVASGDLISGQGRVLNAVSNDGFLRANGGTLTFESNFNDYDGLSNTGVLQAFGGGSLTLFDNATQNFGGTATISGNNSRISAEGFALNMGSGSTLNFSSGGVTYLGTNATTFSGTINVSAGTSAAIVLGGSLATFNSTANGAITDHLVINSPSRFLAGATFTGTGAIVNFTNEVMELENNVDLGVTLDNRGTVELNAGNNIGVVTVANYEGNGELSLDIAGTSLASYDRLLVDQVMDLQAAGDELFVSFLSGVFTAQLGDLFTIATASSILGQFDTVSFTGLASGLGLDVTYNPSSIVLEVVNAMAGIAGDYNDSGSVEQGDLDLVLNNWGQPRPFDANVPPPFATANVDQEELDRVLNNWGNSSVPPIFGSFNAVPEPGVAAVAVGLAGLSLRRRRVA